MAIKAERERVQREMSIEIERLHEIMREINRACIDSAYDSDALIRAEALTRPFVLGGKVKDGSGHE